MNSFTTDEFTHDVVGRGGLVTTTATETVLKLNIDPVSKGWILITVISIMRYIKRVERIIKWLKYCNG